MDTPRGLAAALAFVAASAVVLATEAAPPPTPLPQLADATAAVRAMYAEQLGWAVDEGIDFVISETNDYLGEALIALEVTRDLGLPAMVTLAPTQPDQPARWCQRGADGRSCRPGCAWRSRRAMPASCSPAADWHGATALPWSTARA